MTAGELAAHFPSAKATMSGHFAILKEADLIAADKQGATITYRLQLSVLEDALLAFAESFGIGLTSSDVVRRDRGENEAAT